MLVKLLNKLGLYTEKQAYNITLKTIKELKADFIEENKKLKEDYKNVIAALKVCEDEKRELLFENEDLRRALENRKKQIDMLLKDFERVNDENEKLRLKIAKRVKIAKSVKRRKK